MVQFIDRRENPRNKSLTNKRRFFGRFFRAAHGKHIIRQRTITGKDTQTVTLRDDLAKDAATEAEKTIDQPTFHAGKGGTKKYVLTGNKQFSEGDRVDRESKIASEEDGAEIFSVDLSADEFETFLQEYLGLPRMDKVGGTGHETKPRQIVTSGSTGLMHVPRTFKQSLTRRISLGQPSHHAINAATNALNLAEQDGDPESIEKAKHGLLFLKEKRKGYRLFEETDIRRRNEVQIPEAAKKAVMFCILNGTMERAKTEMAKTFYMVLRHALLKFYSRADIQIVFIHHGLAASEVKEDALFATKFPGEAAASSALKQMKKIIDARYPSSIWNIYAAHASDGANLEEDVVPAAKFMKETLLPLCQHFAYLELKPAGSSFSLSEKLWNAFKAVAKDSPALAMQRATTIHEIWPVFQELFTHGAIRPETKAAAWTQSTGMHNI